jgi:hypothetical protein
MAKPKKYPVKRWVLETMLPYVEAAKCKTLDEIFQELYDIVENEEVKTQ